MARRKAASKTAAQPTISFSSRSTNKITKPLAKPAKSLEKVEKVETPPPPPTVVDVQTKDAPAIDLAIRKQAERPHVAPKGSSEAKAAEVSDVQIKKYWKAKEDERKAPRVHQEGLSTHDKILREFDLSYQFGPCIGITRMKRWKRAENLDLKPPIEVLAVLLKEEAKNNSKAQRAFIDESTSSRTVE